MAVFPGSAIPSAVSDDYEIDNSVRFSEGASGGKLTFTQGTPTGNKAFTYSFWFKGKTDMAGINDNMDFTFLDAAATDNDFISMSRLNGKFQFALIGGTGSGGYLTTTEEFRDPASWYHMVIAVNTEESVAANRMKMYKNGVQITAFDTETYCAEDYVLQNFNTSGVSLRIGQEAGSYPGGAYMAEVYFIDGTQLAPSSFGELDSDTNQWKPLDSDDVKHAVTFGANGFFQKYNSSELDASFEDSSLGSTSTVTFEPTGGALTCDVLVVAGGGGGGNVVGGGGGAGGMRTSTGLVVSSATDVGVGAGGIGGGVGSAVNTNGIRSYFGTLISSGGGRGGSTNLGGSSAGGSGGSGGGGRAAGGSGNSGGYSPVEGYNGGGGSDGGGGGSYETGGGGGSSAVGAASGGSSGGNGGAGTSNDYRTGAGVSYAGGGGGGGTDSGGTGGSGGGGTGGAGVGGAAGDDGTVNTGGGGGGSRTGNGGAGGTGIVVVRYLASSAQATGGTITTYGAGASQYYVHSFTTANAREIHTITAEGDTYNQRPQPHDPAVGGDAHLIGPKQGTSVINFDGTGDYLTVPGSSDFSFTGDWTVEFWINIQSYSDHGTPLMLGTHDAAGEILLQTHTGGYVYYTVRNDSNTAQQGAFPSLGVNTWAHIALVRNGTNTLRLYQDGVQSTEVTSDISGTYGISDETLYIGRRPGGTYEFPGYLDCIRISNTARYPDGTTFTPPTTAFTNDGNTKLLIQSGTDGSQTFDDLSTGDHTITANGDVRWFAPKVGAGAMVFNGSDAYLSLSSSVGNSLIGGSGDWTIEGWVKWISGSSIFMEQGDNNERALQFWVQPDGDIQIYLSNTDGSWDFNNISG